jgi:N-acetyl-1-D-myo-inositol-2-amino-2-deoxy-alpha-D-glucopyranoside deacetylase
LGARLRAADVRAAHDRLAEVLPDEQVGSGRVTGCADTPSLHDIGCTDDSALRRRQALDQYATGLGTTALPDLLTAYHRRGDSLLLRVLLDVAGWRTDRFEPL